jgi:hypothetical protein
MEPAAQLRLAVALAHALPAGTVELHTDDGSMLEASHDPQRRTSLTPCDLRAALLARACPMWPTVTARIADVGISADGLVDLGGGLYTQELLHAARHPTEAP